MHIDSGRARVGLRDALPDLKHISGDGEHRIIVFFFGGGSQFPLELLVEISPPLPCPVLKLIFFFFIGRAEDIPFDVVFRLSFETFEQFAVERSTFLGIGPCTGQMNKMDRINAKGAMERKRKN